MSFRRTKQEQYIIDRDLALYHGIDRDTPGGRIGRGLRESRAMGTPIWTPNGDFTRTSPTAVVKEKKSESFGEWLVGVILLLILL